MTRAELLALADCVECLCLFANEGIGMTPEGPNSNPQDVLCRLVEVLGLEEWSECVPALRAKAEDQDSVLLFALLGAYHSGDVSGLQDSQIGATFRGALPAAEDAGCADDRRLRSMFVTGYVGAVNRLHPRGVPTENGKVVKR